MTTPCRSVRGFGRVTPRRSGSRDQRSSIAPAPHAERRCEGYRGRTHGSPERVVRNSRARLYASVRLMPRTAAASSTVRNGRSLGGGRIGTDRDTKTSTGECGCVLPSSVAFSATHSFGAAFRDATKKLGEGPIRLQLNTDHSQRSPPDRNSTRRPPAPAGALAAPPADRSGGVKTELPQRSEEERS